MSAPALEGFESFTFSHDGDVRDVYRRGVGPGVVVIHEVPGITPEVAGFARRVADEGFTVFLPHLFGTPGKPFSAAYALAGVVHCCISREFHVLAERGSSPITDWLRALCREAHRQCGGPGVGAIGMCMTGNFALALMVDESVMAPVLSQPSLPFPLTAAKRAAVHLSDADLAVVRALHRRPGGPRGALRDAPPRARRRLRSDRDRFVPRQPARHPEKRALGRDEGPRRPGWPPDPRGARARARVLPGEAQAGQRLTSRVDSRRRSSHHTSLP
jgi:dienelactone hydrolase